MICCKAGKKTVPRQKELQAQVILCE